MVLERRRWPGTVRLAAIGIGELIGIVVGIAITLGLPSITDLAAGNRINAQESPDPGIVVALLDTVLQQQSS